MLRPGVLNYAAVRSRQQAHGQQSHQSGGSVPSQGNRAGGVQHDPEVQRWQAIYEQCRSSLLAAVPVLLKERDKVLDGENKGGADHVGANYATSSAPGGGAAASTSNDQILSNSNRKNIPPDNSTKLQQQAQSIHVTLDTLGDLLADLLGWMDRQEQKALQQGTATAGGASRQSELHKHQTAQGLIVGCLLSCASAYKALGHFKLAILYYKELLLQTSKGRHHYQQQLLRQSSSSSAVRNVVKTTLYTSREFQEQICCEAAECAWRRGDFFTAKFFLVEGMRGLKAEQHALTNHGVAASAGAGAAGGAPRAAGRKLLHQAGREPNNNDDSEELLDPLSAHLAQVQEEWDLWKQQEHFRISPLLQEFANIKEIEFDVLERGLFAEPAARFHEQKRQELLLHLRERQKIVVKGLSLLNMLDAIWGFVAPAADNGSKRKYKYHSSTTGSGHQDRDNSTDERFSAMAAGTTGPSQASHHHHQVKQRISDTEAVVFPFTLVSIDLEEFGAEDENDLPKDAGAAGAAASSSIAVNAGGPISAGAVAGSRNKTKHGVNFDEVVTEEVVDFDEDVVMQDPQQEEHEQDDSDPRNNKNQQQGQQPASLVDIFYHSCLEFAEARRDVCASIAAGAGGGSSSFAGGASAASGSGGSSSSSAVHNTVAASRTAKNNTRRLQISQLPAFIMGDSGGEAISAAEKELMDKVWKLVNTTTSSTTSNHEGTAGGAAMLNAAALGSSSKGGRAGPHSTSASTATSRRPLQVYLREILGEIFSTTNDPIAVCTKPARKVLAKLVRYFLNLNVKTFVASSTAVVSSSDYPTAHDVAGHDHAANMNLWSSKDELLEVLFAETKAELQMRDEQEGTDSIKSRGLMNGNEKEQAAGTTSNGKRTPDQRLRELQALLATEDLDKQFSADELEKLNSLDFDKDIARIDAMLDQASEFRKRGPLRPQGRGRQGDPQVTTAFASVGAPGSLKRGREEQGLNVEDTSSSKVVQLADINPGRVLASGGTIKNADGQNRTDGTSSGDVIMTDVASRTTGTKTTLIVGGQDDTVLVESVTFPAHCAAFAEANTRNGRSTVPSAEQDVGSTAAPSSASLPDYEKAPLRFMPNRTISEDDHDGQKKVDQNTKEHSFPLSTTRSIESCDASRARTRLFLQQHGLACAELFASQDLFADAFGLLHLRFSVLIEDHETGRDLLHNHEQEAENDPVRGMKMLRQSDSPGSLLYQFCLLLQPLCDAYFAKGVFFLEHDRGFRSLIHLAEKHDALVAEKKIRAARGGQQQQHPASGDSSAGGLFDSTFAISLQDQLLRVFRILQKFCRFSEHLAPSLFRTSVWDFVARKHSEKNSATKLEIKNNGLTGSSAATNFASASNPSGIFLPNKAAPIGHKITIASPCATPGWLLEDPFAADEFFTQRIVPDFMSRTNTKTNTPSKGGIVSAIAANFIGNNSNKDTLVHPATGGASAPGGTGAKNLSKIWAKAADVLGTFAVKQYESVERVALDNLSRQEREDPYLVANAASYLEVAKILRVLLHDEAPLPEQGGRNLMGGGRVLVGDGGLSTSTSNGGASAILASSAEDGMLSKLNYALILLLASFLKAPDERRFLAPLCSVALMCLVKHSVDVTGLVSSAPTGGTVPEAPTSRTAVGPGALGAAAGAPWRVGANVGAPASSGGSSNFLFSTGATSAPVDKGKNDSNLFTLVGGNKVSPCAPLFGGLLAAIVGAAPGSSPSKSGVEKQKINAGNTSAKTSSGTTSAGTTGSAAHPKNKGENLISAHARAYLSSLSHLLQSLHAMHHEVCFQFKRSSLQVESLRWPFSVYELLFSLDDSTSYPGGGAGAATGVAVSKSGSTAANPGAATSLLISTTYAGLSNQQVQQQLHKKSQQHRGLLADKAFFEKQLFPELFDVEDTTLVNKTAIEHLEKQENDMLLDEVLLDSAGAAPAGNVKTNKPTSGSSSTATANNPATASFMRVHSLSPFPSFIMQNKYNQTPHFWHHMHDKLSKPTPHYAPCVDLLCDAHIWI